MPLPTRSRSLRRPQTNTAKSEVDDDVSPEITQGILNKAPHLEPSKPATSPVRSTHSPSRLPVFGASKGTTTAQGPAFDKRTIRRGSPIRPKETAPATGDDRGDSVQVSERVTNERPSTPSDNRDDGAAQDDEIPQKETVAVRGAIKSSPKSTKKQPSNQTSLSSAQVNKTSMRPPGSTTRQLRRPMNHPVSSQSATPMKQSTLATPRATTIVMPASRPESNLTRIKSIKKPRPASAASGTSDDTTHDQQKERRMSIRRSTQNKSELQQSSDLADRTRGAAPKYESTREAPSASNVRTKPVTRADTSLKSRKAEFSTMQQHFTPRKGPKALTSSFLVPSPSNLPRADAISAETARQQAELLQLQILHCASFKVQQQWKESAHSKMAELFHQTARKQSQLSDQEHQIQQKLNYRALQDWADGSKYGHGLEERMQVLSPILQDTLSMTNSRGRYTKVISEFEDWWARVQRTQDTREGEAAGSVPASNTDLELIEGLGFHWKAEMNALSRKLSVQTRQLEDIGHAIEGSSLATILENLRNYVASMLEELALVQMFERETLETESLFIKTMMTSLNIEGDDSDAEVPKTRRGVWEVS